MPDQIELGAQRAVDHPRPQLDDKPAENGWIDLHIDLNMLAGDRMQRFSDRGQVPLARLLRDPHFGADLAAMARDQLAIRLDHVADREQAPVARNGQQELRRETLHAGKIKDGAQGTDLLVGTEYRTADQTQEISIAGNERIEPIEIGAHRVHGILLERKLEQRGCVAARHAGQVCLFACHFYYSLGNSAGAGTADDGRQALEIRLGLQSRSERGTPWNAPKIARFRNPASPVA